MDRRKEKGTKLPERLQKALAGKRLILGGLENKLYQAVLNRLELLREQGRLDITVSQNPETAGREDFVLLFSGMEVRGTENFQQLNRLIQQLVQLQERRPAAAVLVSEDRVYGKQFGPQTACREEDCGYVCHVSEEDMSLQCMRMAEHLACRLAAEEHLPMKVVRAGGKAAGSEAEYRAKHTPELVRAGSGPADRAEERRTERMADAACADNEADSLTGLAAAVLYVLIYGSPGEIYNLPDYLPESSDLKDRKGVRSAGRDEDHLPESSDLEKRENSSMELPKKDRGPAPHSAAERENGAVLTWTEARSPLSPMKTEMNTEKFSALFYAVQKTDPAEK